MRLQWITFTFFFFQSIILFQPIDALAHKSDAVIAVASNFTEPAKEIAKKFEESTGYKTILSFGATGSIYQQIKNGAPYDVFLAADNHRPSLLIAEGFAVKESQLTYAIGTLVLWSASKDLIKGEQSLSAENINHIAFCNPDAAPYGQAALETMKALNLYTKVQTKLVEGHNISQAFQFVKTGNAEIGFVALSQIIHEKKGSFWIVPQKYYHPIEQDGVLLQHGKDNKAAKAFMIFLNGSEASQILADYGYRKKKKDL
ncbi:molybdate ABC transporter substrate-binding protein [Bartonella tamiae]|uniref:Molybdate ABC transporter, periplasmic molybdate-binding protein n=1 Tax=Bartonella tamiae Th239 TaxID=1094558 RepID=J1K278_9HYPH|nr:molybdate ABC transporter substrate-binding protein [Bartonella tamiae]EJF91577.1 molybdate ABC transporter, periplasmic molybdate-binding protein [Bartonella tamiae Th239]EJF92439.1 molybdate ABC transporter, periplasmic molybdate-binding protein [Bartonella tamiae Th307]